MSVYSMTGYASRKDTPALAQDTAHMEHAATTVATGTAPAWVLHLELRSVNSRFLDMTLKLPEELRMFETSAREKLQKTLRRGKVELRASLEKPAASMGTISAPAAALLQRLASVQEAIQTWLPDAAPLSVADVMQLQLGRAGAATELPEQALQACFASAMDKLLQAFLQSRATEGTQLAQSLLQRTAQLRMLAQQAEPLIPQLVQQQRARFLEKWRDALAAASTTSGNSAATPVSAEAAQERALSEATAFAIRIDVAEEITRLQSHLDAIEALLHKGGELGKRLEFLIQELHREANTLGSKSAALETSRISVDMKVLIEQMREQVQNLE